MTESAAGELSTSRRIARNALFRSAGEVVAKVGSVAFLIAMARELGQGGFGDFSFALALTTILLYASGFGMEDLLVREVSRRRSEVHRYVSNVMAVKLCSSVVLLSVALAITAISGQGAELQATVLLVGIGVGVENFGKTFHSVFQAYERMAFISIALIVQRIATAAVGVAVLVAGGGLLAASAVFTGGSVLGFVVSAWTLRRFVVAPRLEIDRAFWLPLVKAAAPIGVATLFFVVLLKLDATLLGLIRDTAEVGIYSAAFRLIEATMFISWAFGSALFPWLARQEDASERLARGFERGLKGLSAVLLPIGLGFVLLADPLIDLLYGPEYAAAVFPLRMLGIMTVLYGVNSLASAALVARDRPGEFTRIIGIVTAVNLVSNLILIPRYGADGAAFSAALCAALLAVLGLWRTAAVIGRLNPIRAFLGPAAAGGAMTAAVLSSDAALVPAAALGFGAYLVALALFERAAFADDFRMAVEVFRHRRPPPPLPMPSEL